MVSPCSHRHRNRRTYRDDPNLTLWQVRKFDLLHSYRLSGAHIQSPVDGTKSPFAQTVPDFLDLSFSLGILHKQSEHYGIAYVVLKLSNILCWLRSACLLLKLTWCAMALSVSFIWLRLRPIALACIGGDLPVLRYAGHHIVSLYLWRTGRGFLAIKLVLVFIAALCLFYNIATLCSYDP